MAAAIEGYVLKKSPWQAAIFWLFLVLPVTTSNTYLNEKLSFWPRRRAVEFLLLRRRRRRRHPSSTVVVAQNFTLKKTEGKISHKIRIFCPTRTPNPLMESPYKTGYKNGTFAALNGAKNTNLTEMSYH